MAIPKQVGHNPSPPIVGNMGDDLIQISPCAITVWNERFIALVASDNVIKFNLPKGTNYPSLTSTPITQDDPTPGYVVHAPITNPGEVLVFTTLPTILPVPYGIPLLNGNFIAKNIFDPFSDTTYPFGKVWMTAMNAHPHTQLGKAFPRAQWAISGQ